MKLLNRVRSYMLGTAIEDEDDGYFEEEMIEEDYEEEPRYARREREKEQNLFSGARKSWQPETKVVNLPTAAHTSQKMQVTICKPTVVDDATSICDYLKEDIICIVNLEGVERLNAQRIADFLGGSCYALGGEIQRVNNEIFLIAPTSVGISSELREELKDSGLILPWIASAFK